MVSGLEARRGANVKQQGDAEKESRLREGIEPAGCGRSVPVPETWREERQFCSGAGSRLVKSLNKSQSPVRKLFFEGDLKQNILFPVTDPIIHCRLKDIVMLYLNLMWGFHSLHLK